MYSSWFYVLLITRVTAEAKRIIDYHVDVGIPLAKWIKETEDKIHARPVSGRRIVGGSVAPKKMYPYLGGLIIRIKKVKVPSVCGSTLITANRLLTAAHCWKSQTSEGRRLTVVLGSEFLFRGGTRIVSTDVLLHPAFERVTLRNDIAIISLNKSVTFSDSIKPATLPHSYVNNTFEGEWMYTAGYGKTGKNSPMTLKSVINHVRLQVMPISECNLYYFNNAVQPNNICTNGTGGVAICDGDSGGPLISIQNGEAILVGISSFLAEGDCEDGYPSVFARVASFLPFITQHT